MISFKEYIKELNSEELYKYHSNVPKDDFIKILKADPTHQEDDKGDVRLVGKYSKWMIGKYLKKQLKIEDLYKATKYLDIYNRHKDKLPIEKRDINKFINLPDLFTEIDKIKEEKPEALKSEVDIKDDETQITYEDESWKILTPLTKESACAWGSGTEWCTAHSGSDMFEHYSEFGELIILINKKKPKEKYQYHVHSGQLMDVSDTPVYAHSVYLFLSPGARKEVREDFIKLSIINGLYDYQAFDKFYKVSKQELEMALLELFSFMVDAKENALDVEYDFDFNILKYFDPIPDKLLKEISFLDYTHWQSDHSKSIEYALLKSYEKNMDDAYRLKIEKMFYDFFDFGRYEDQEIEESHVIYNIIRDNILDEKKCTEIIKRYISSFNISTRIKKTILTLIDVFDKIVGYTHRKFKFTDPKIQQLFNEVMNGMAEDETSTINVTKYMKIFRGEE